MKNKKLIFLLIPLLALASCSVSFDDGGGDNPPPPDPSDSTYWDVDQDSLRTGRKTLDFYNLNDTHGTVNYSQDSNEPGLSRLSTFFKTKKSANRAGFVLTSSGDMWQGSADSNITRGKLVTDWMNYLEFSAMSIGNHEFDWTIDVIKENAALSNFPILGCNVLSKDNYQPVDWLKPYTTITRNGVHIGIIGSIGQGLTNTILSKNVKDLTFADPTPYIKQHSKFLKEHGADVILYLTHHAAYSINSSLKDYIDLAFCAHTHQCERSSLGDIPLVQAGSNGKYIGHINLEYDFNNKRIVYGDYGYSDTAMNYDTDQGTDALWEPYNEEIETTNNRVVSTYQNAIYKSDIPNIYNQYAYKYYLETKEANNFDFEIFAVETNNARASIYPTAGVGVTYGMVYKALPFDNTLCLIHVSGYRIINNLLTYSSSHWYLPSVGSVSLDNVYNYVDENKDYYILTIDYIANYESYAGWMDVVHTYYEEDALPRNIFSRYLNQYPSNIQ